MPGRDRDLAQLLDAYRAVTDDGRGQIIFVAGEEGSGRTGLLHCLHSELRTNKLGATVLAGGFNRTDYVAWDEIAAPSRISSLLNGILMIGEPTATLIGGLLPFAPLLAQVLARSKAALQLVEGFSRQASAPDLSTLMPHLLRTMCAEGPVVCIVDDADHASDGWWMDLVFLFARRVARDLPLLLVLSVTGPRELSAHHNGVSDALDTARQLTSEHLAKWHALAPVTASDLQRWTGPTKPDVARTLLDVTDGRAGWIAQLWDSWQDRAVVTREITGHPWRFTAARALPVDEIDDLLGARLRLLLGVADAKAIERSRDLLCCAALEGQRFTAEAIAAALERDRDDVNDELDATFVLDDAHPNGLLLEDGSITIVDEHGERTVWLYRFKAQLDWLTLRHHGMTNREERDLSLRLADALRACYGRETHRIAQTLVRLYTTGDNSDAAEPYRRMATIGVNRDLIIWRADNALQSPDPVGPSERSRTSAILLAAGRELFHSGPFQDCRAFADAAHRLATTDADRATALYYRGVSLWHLGKTPLAVRDLAAARQLYQSIGDRRGEAAVRASTALVDYQQGNYDKARNEYLTILEIRRELKDRGGEAYTLHSLANISSIHGEYSKASDEYTAALQIHNELGDRRGEAFTRHELAHLYFLQGDYDKAREEFLTVLETHRVLGDRKGEASARFEFANIQYRQGEYGKARDEYLAVLDIHRELGDRHSEALAHFAIATTYYQEETDDRARTEYLAALEIHRELDYRLGEATTLHDLANISYRQGDYARARDGYLAALKIQSLLGYQPGEAVTRYALACISCAQGQYDIAQSEYLAILEIQCKLEDRHGEGFTRQSLGNIHSMRGDQDKARDEYLAALKIRSELGDQCGEAITRRSLASLEDKRRSEPGNGE